VGKEVSCLADGERLTGTYVACGVRSFVIRAGKTLELSPILSEYEHDDGSEGGGAVRAPMPGKVIAVLVAEGARVQKGTPLLRLEAMKMEHTLNATCDGVITTVSVREQDQVEEGQTLLVLAEDDEQETSP
jgi:3-methylcrotonyl-CoA carboxylase alpha subunit